MNELKDQNFLGIFSLIAIIVLIWLFQSFLLVLLFAGIFAISTYPIFNALTIRLSEGISALLMCFFTFIFIILPLIYLISVSVIALNRELPNLINQIQMLDLEGLFNSGKSYLMSIATINNWIDLENQNFSQYATEIKSMVIGSSQYLLKASSFLIGSLNWLITLALFLFSLFFFYKDADEIVIKIRTLLPTSTLMSKKILGLFESLCSIYLVNVLVLAIIQGFGFAIVVSFFDLPPAYLGLLFTLASFIPVVGTLLIWFPVIIYLLLINQLEAAIWVLTYSVVISGGVIDYVLRAKIIDKLSDYYPNQTLKQSSLVIILSTLAGIIEFGVIGLILGPLVASGALGLIHFYLESKASKSSQT